MFQMWEQKPLNAPPNVDWANSVPAVSDKDSHWRGKSQCQTVRSLTMLPSDTGRPVRNIPQSPPAPFQLIWMSELTSEVARSASHTPPRPPWIPAPRQRDRRASRSESITGACDEHLNHMGPITNTVTRHEQHPVCIFQFITIFILCPRSKQIGRRSEMTKVFLLRRRKWVSYGAQRALSAPLK